MDTIDLSRFVFSFLFVLGLIGLCAFALKRYSRTASGALLLGQGLFKPPQAGARLELIEMRPLDARRKLVLVRRDDKEYLLLLADNRELVLESWVRTNDEAELPCVD